MKSIEGIIKKICAITDLLAGVCFFSVMALVLVNIILRSIFKLPILGTVEIVGLLTATGLGLALSNCEMKNGNIAMDVLTEKFSKGVQRVIDIIIYIISLGFFGIVVWRIIIFANTSFINGRVTATVSIPIAPFIFILGFNVACLCAVLAYKLVNALNDAPPESLESANAGKEGSK